MPSSGHFEDYISGLDTDATPDADNDYLMSLDATDGHIKKILLSDAQGSSAGDVTYAAILASQLVNEIKGWPSIKNEGDLDALNLWFDKVGTPSTAPSVVALSGEAGITENWELALKVVADAANEGLLQRFIYADEHRVKSGKKLSTLWAIWCVGGIGVTLSIVNSSAEETSATKVTGAEWAIVEVPNHTLAGTYCDVKLTTDGAGTFYAVPLGANIGERGFPLPQRPSRFVEVNFIAHGTVSGLDGGGSDFTDADFTSLTSALTHKLHINILYKNDTNIEKRVQLRRNGSTDALGQLGAIANVLAKYHYSIHQIECDDSQIIEYKSNAAAGDTESITLCLIGYDEWG